MLVLNLVLGVGLCPVLALRKGGIENEVGCEAYACESWGDEIRLCLEKRPKLCHEAPDSVFAWNKPIKAKKISYDSSDGNE